MTERGAHHPQHGPIDSQLGHCDRALFSRKGVLQRRIVALYAAYQSGQANVRFT